MCLHFFNTFFGKWRARRPFKLRKVRREFRSLSSFVFGRFEQDSNLWDGIQILGGQGLHILQNSVYSMSHAAEK